MALVVVARLALLVLAVTAAAVVAKPAPEGDEICHFTCPEQEGSFADPCTCRRFYKCDGGAQFKSFCPNGLHWDDIRKFCTYKNEAVCGPVNADQLKQQKQQAEADDAQRAKACQPAQCQLPYCACGAPNATVAAAGPQFILVSIDGAINNNNFDLYVDVLEKALNSTVRTTFFVEHEYCSYAKVEYMRGRGHEIALGSVTGESLQNANVTRWRREIRSLRQILHKYANVPEEELVGIRAPKTRPGRNEQYEALVAENLVWDSSVSTLPLKDLVWPYTLDYRIPHTCQMDSCPTRAFPGLWELPLNAHSVETNSGGHCSFLDQCIFTFQTGDNVFEWLQEDFNRFYKTNRAPYTLALHTNWFLEAHQVDGLKKFLMWVSTELKDVHFVTATEFLLWLTDPERDSKPFVAAAPTVTPPRCKEPRTCQLPHTDHEGVAATRYLETCSECPLKYPWLISEEDLDKEAATAN